MDFAEKLTVRFSEEVVEPRMVRDGKIRKKASKNADF